MCACAFICLMLTCACVCLSVTLLSAGFHLAVCDLASSWLWMLSLFGWGKWTAGMESDSCWLEEAKSFLCWNWGHFFIMEPWRGFCTYKVRIIDCIHADAHSGLQQLSALAERYELGCCRCLLHKLTRMLKAYKRNMAVNNNERPLLNSLQGMVICLPLPLLFFVPTALTIQSIHMRTKV